MGASFPDANNLHLLTDRTRPNRNNFQGPWSDYQPTPEQNAGSMKLRKRLDEWVADSRLQAGGLWRECGRPRSISPVVMQTSSRRRRPPLDGKDPFAHLTYKVTIVCTRDLVLIQTVNPTPALRPDQRQSHTVLGSPQQTMAARLAIVRIPTVRATSSVSRVLCHLPPISFVISPLSASSAMTNSRYGGVFIR